MRRTTRAPRVSAAEARVRILDAARRLLHDRPFADLTVDAVMGEAGLARTVFYRHFDDLPQLAPHLLPDAGAPLIDRVREAGADDPRATADAMLDALVSVFAAHGPLLRAIDDAAAHDPAVAEQLDVSLVGPRRLIAALLASAPHPPPDPRESARMLMATHRSYLLDTFGSGRSTAARRRKARAALGALWERLLAP